MKAVFDPDQFKHGVQRSAVGAVVALALLAGAVMINTLAFEALTSIVFVFVTLAWGDLNKLSGLASAQPMQSLLAWWTLGGLPSLALSALHERRPKQWDEMRSDEQLVGPIGLGLLDEIIAMLVTLAFLAAFGLWLLVVVPLQYLVYLVAGAPARQAFASVYRAWALVTDRGLAAAVTPKWHPIPEGAIESGFSAQPVAFTAALAAALLFAVSTLTG